LPSPAGGRTLTPCPFALTPESPSPRALSRKRERGSDRRALRNSGIPLKRGSDRRAGARQRYPIGAGGFTLLEMLMAIVLLGLLLAGAYSGIQTSVRAMHAGERLIERIDRVRTVQEFLRHQLTRILPISYAQTDAKTYVFEGERDFMRFVAPMPGYLSHGGPYVQTLAFVRGNGGMSLVFSGTMLNGFDWQEEKKSEREPVVLVDHIADGSFSYRALDDQGQLAAWSTSWDDPSITPLLVRVELTMQNGAQVNWPVLAVPLMLDAGATRSQPIAIPRLMPNTGGAPR